MLVANNDGGGIFANLPIHNVLDEQTFDDLFRTPHGTDLRFINDVEGASYVSVASEQELDSALRTSPQSPLYVIEAHVDRIARATLRDAIAEAIAR